MKDNKENKDILAKAIEQLKNEQIASGPPQELTDATITKLNEAARQSKGEEQAKILTRIRTTNSFMKLTLKFAAAAVLLVVAGYTVGRLSAARQPDIEELYSALEPVIRQRLLEQINHQWQLVLASNNAQIKDELSNQYRRDLNESAVQTLAASSAVTHQLLEELIDAIDAAQTQDRQWVTTAIKQIELNRIQDSTQLSNALVSFAAQTEDELLRTKQDMVQLLSYQSR